MRAALLAVGLVTINVVACGSRAKHREAPSVPPSSAREADDRPISDGAHLVVSTGHGAQIRQIAASADGQRIATLADDRIVRVFAAGDLRELARVFVAGATPFEIALDEHGGRVAVEYADATIVFDVASGTQLGRVPAGSYSPCMLFDGADLLLYRDGLVRWQVGQPLQHIASPTQKCLAIGQLAGELAVYDGTQLVRGPLTGAAWNATPQSVAISSAPDVAIGPRWIAWADGAATYVWKPGDSVQTEVAPAPNAELTWIEGGSVLLAASFKGTFRVDVATGTRTPVDGSEATIGVGATRIAFANEETLCAADAKPKSAATCLQSSGGPVRSLVTTKSGQLLVGADHAPIRRWLLGAPPDLQHWSVWAYPAVYGQIALSPDQQQLAQAEISELVVRDVGGDHRRTLLEGDCEGVAWSPDGVWIATTRRDSIVRTRVDGGGSTVVSHAIPPVRPSPWFIAHGDPDAHAGRRERRLVYRDDGIVLAAGTYDEVVLVRGDAVIATLTGGPEVPGVTALAFRPGTHDLVVGFADGKLRTWDTDHVELPAREVTVGAAVAALVFDAAGDQLLVATDDMHVRALSWPNGRTVHDIATHTTTALSIAILPHGRIATGHVDGVVRIFDVARGALTAELYAAKTSGVEGWLVAGADGRIEASMVGDGSWFYGVRDGAFVPFTDFAGPRRRTGVLEAALLDPSDRPRRGPAGPKIAVQSWSRQIAQLTFTSDGRELLGTADDGVYAFDVTSGLLRARLADKQTQGRIIPVGDSFYRGAQGRLEHRELTDGAVIAAQDGLVNQVIGATRSGALVVREFDGISVLAKDSFRAAHTVARTDPSKPSDAALSPGGDLLVRADGDGIAHLHAAEDLREIASVRCSWDLAWKVAVDATGKWIACATTRHSVIVIHPDGSGAFVIRPDLFEGGLGMFMPAIYGMAFHPSKPWLAITASDGIFLYDLEHGGTQLKLDSDPTRYDALAWSPDGSLLATSELGGAVQIFDTTNGARLHSMTPTAARIRHLGRARPGELVFSEWDTSHAMRIWDVATGEERALDDGRSQSDAAASADGGVIAIAEYARGWSSDPNHLPDSIAIDAHGVRSRIDFGDVQFEAIDVDDHHVYVATGSKPDDEHVTIASYELAHGTLAWTQRVAGTVYGFRAGARGELGVALSIQDGKGFTHSHGEAIVFGTDGHRVATVESDADRDFGDMLELADGRWLMSQVNEVELWDPATNKLAPGSFSARHFGASPDGSRLVACGAHELHVLDARTGGVRASGRAVDREIDRCELVTNRMIATTFKDSTIGIWTVDDAQVELAGDLVVAPEHGIVFVARDGHYLATGQAATALGVVLDNDVFEFDQFDASLNRPDLALRALGEASPQTLALYEAAARKREVIRPPDNVVATRASMPTVAIATPLPLRTADATIPVHMRAKAARGSLASINIRVNGVPVFGRAGLDVLAKHVSQLEISHDVALGVGDNRIELEALDDRGVLALGRTELVTREGTPNPGTLHVISIGVSKYVEGHDLKYAAKDASDVADALEKAFSPNVPVVKTVLRDDQVTRASILALRKQLDQTAIEDTVVVFISGHGLLDPDDDRYVFATHDVSFDKPRSKGVSFDELEGLLDGIPARRRLLMIDTCHAGELDAEELAYVEQAERAGAKGVHRIQIKRPATKQGVDPRARAIAARTFFTELRRAAGATVLTASAGAEYSYEDSTIQNGLFTHALLEGISQSAADVDKDGAIHISELLNYLAATVSSHTGGFQIPQARELNRDLDFDLAPAHPHKTFFTFDKCIGQGAMQMVTGPNGALAMAYTPDTTITYACGALNALAGPGQASATPAAMLDAYQKAMTDSAPLLKLSTKEQRTGGVIVRQIVATVPGFALPAARAWAAVDPATKRFAACVALDGVPAAADRCARTITLLAHANPLQELPQ